MSVIPPTETSTGLPAEVDVIVIGSGAAALTGAFTAAVGGLSVLVLEKTTLVGGTCAYSGAGLWFPGNHILARAGVEDSVEAGLNYLKATVGVRTPQSMQEAYVRTGPELVRFLEEVGELELEYMPFPDYYEAPGRAKPSGRGLRPKSIDGRCLGPALEMLRPTAPADKFGQQVSRDVLEGGQSLLAQLLLALDRTGNADLRLLCPMESLLLDGGEVVGVEAAGQQVRARRGVLLAAGGYECSQELRSAHHGVARAEWSSAPIGTNTGDALAAVRSAGGDVDLLDEAWWAVAVLFPNGRTHFLPVVSGGIFVGPDGRRFVNEALPYDQLGHALLDKLRAEGGDAATWWVFDSRAPRAPGMCEPMDLTDPEKTPVLVVDDTLEGLADQIGVPSDSLRETVDRFNKAAVNGVDADHGRGVDDYDLFFADGDGPNAALVALGVGPYRAVRVVLSDLGAKGGARTNASSQVLQPDGQPIRGLYAAGNSAASVAGHVYPGPGVPLGSGMTFGYLAANAMLAAAETPSACSH